MTYHIEYLFGPDTWTIDQTPTVYTDLQAAIEAAKKDIQKTRVMGTDDKVYWQSDKNEQELPDAEDLRRGGFDSIAEIVGCLVKESNYDDQTGVT